MSQHPTPENIKKLLIKAYSAFNDRNADAVLSLMQPDVHWPNGMEGGYVDGHQAVRNYWTRQWSMINPHVEPTDFEQKDDSHTRVIVHQVVKDMKGNLLMDRMIEHVYLIEDGLIKSMEISEP